MRTNRCASFVVFMMLLHAAVPLLARPPFRGETRLLPAEVQDGDLFGWALSASGNWLAVGAPGADQGGAENAGAIYLYRQQAGAWVQSATLLPSTPSANLSFGYNVLVAGEHLFAYAVAGDRGGVYVYERDGDDWLLQQELGTDEFDRFGKSLCYTGRYLIVGRDDKSHVFESKAAGWKRVGTVARTHFSNSPLHAWALACDSDYLVVGSPVAGRGRVDVFKRKGKRWKSPVRLDPDDTRANAFGSAVALENGRIVAGAKDANVGREGRVYTFVLEDGEWVKESLVLAKDGNRGDDFGQGVDYDGKYLAVVDSAAVVGGEAAGAGYVFRKRGKKWKRKARVTASDSEEAALFGGFSLPNAIDLDRGALFIGAPTAGGVNPIGQLRLRGAVYVFD